MIDKCNLFASNRIKKTVITEFPPIGTGTKRTKSWHNFNRSMSTLRISSGADIINYESADNLQLKLSLKKQIWAGAWSDNGGGGIDRSRPLSWGVPSGLKNTSNYLEVREYDSEKLLIACSQKLAAWQETGERQVTNKSNQRNTGNQNRRQTTKQLHISTTNLTARCSIANLGDMSLAKARKKPKGFSLTKIVEATDFITHLSQNSKNTRARKMSGPTQLPGTTTNNTVYSNHLHFGLVPSSTSLLSNVSKSRPFPTLKKRNKFKTSGIVATAVQQSNAGVAKRGNNPKKGRQSKVLHFQETTMTTTAASCYGDSGSAENTITNHNQSGIVKTLVKKVKSKKKPKLK